MYVCMCLCFLNETHKDLNVFECLPDDWFTVPYTCLTHMRFHMVKTKISLSHVSWSDTLQKYWGFIFIIKKTQGYDYIWSPINILLISINRTNLSSLGHFHWEWSDKPLSRVRHGYVTKVVFDLWIRQGANADQDVVILTKFSSLATPDVVNLKSSVLKKKTVQTDLSLF